MWKSPSQLWASLQGQTQLSPWRTSNSIFRSFFFSKFPRRQSTQSPAGRVQLWLATFQELRDQKPGQQWSICKPSLNPPVFWVMFFSAMPGILESRASLLPPLLRRNCQWSRGHWEGRSLAARVTGEDLRLLLQTGASDVGSLPRSCSFHLHGSSHPQTLHFQLSQTCRVICRSSIHVAASRFCSCSFWKTSYLVL